MTPQTVRLPNGKSVSLGYYVAEWKRAKTLPLNATVTGWQWYPVSVRDVLRDLRRSIDDRINRRAGIIVAPLSNKMEARILRRFRQRVRHECRWCGTPLGRYALPHDRFCDHECRRAHNG